MSVEIKMFNNEVVRSTPCQNSAFIEVLIQLLKVYMCWDIEGEWDKLDLEWASISVFG